MVPELQDMKETSKNIILNKAATYVRLLRKNNLALKKEIDHVAKENAKLRQHLQLAKTTFYSIPTNNYGFFTSQQE